MLNVLAGFGLMGTYIVAVYSVDKVTPALEVLGFFVGWCAVSTTLAEKK